MNHLFIVGAQRSGSTYLYHLLDSHPQVMMARPVRPEPKFFLSLELFSKGRDFYETTYFKNATPETRCLGEKSTSYIESLTAAQRIKQFYPDAHVLMILRDPVERAWSNYRFSVQNGLETLPFDAALEAEAERLSHRKVPTSVNPYAYQRRGLYIDYIDEYLKVFGREQLHVLIFEEMVGNLTSAQALYYSLDLDDSFVPPSLTEVINSTERKEESPVGGFRRLAAGYHSSVERLEQHLNRPLEVWRRHWEAWGIPSVLGSE